MYKHAGNSALTKPGALYMNMYAYVHIRISYTCICVNMYIINASNSSASTPGALYMHMCVYVYPLSIVYMLMYVHVYIRKFCSL